MSHLKPRVVVFASSAFAQPLIAFLVQKKMLVGVVIPDPNEHQAIAPQITGMASQLQQANIPFLWSSKSKLPLIQSHLEEWQANVGIIATYPDVLPQELLDYFLVDTPFVIDTPDTNKRYGIYNLHASDLPAYRGPQPLYWQIREAKPSTYLVMHHAEAEVDSGRVICKRDIPIHSLDTLPSLTNRIAFEAVNVVDKFLDDLVEKKVVPIGEDQLPATLNKNSPKYFSQRPTREELLIDFETMDGHQISAMCRAGNGSEFAAYLCVKGVPISIMQSTSVDRSGYGTPPGTIIFIGEPEGLIISVKGGALRLDILAGPDGIYTGLMFAERFQLDAGMSLAPASSFFKKFA